MPDVLNVTYRYYPVFVPHWIVLYGMILPRSEPKDEHEVSFEQEATKVTKPLLPWLPPFQNLLLRNGRFTVWLVSWEGFPIAGGRS